MPSGCKPLCRSGKRWLHLRRQVRRSRGLRRRIGAICPHQTCPVVKDEFCDGHHRQRLNELLSLQGELEPRGPSMMSKDIIVAVAITFAVTFAILAAKMAQSDNDRASNPTISTLPLQY